MAVNIGYQLISAQNRKAASHYDKRFNSTMDYIKKQWDVHIRKSKLFLMPKTLV
jgi:hypothetical protein